MKKNFAEGYERRRKRIAEEVTTWNGKSVEWEERRGVVWMDGRGFEGLGGWVGRGGVWLDGIG